MSTPAPRSSCILTLYSSSLLNHIHITTDFLSCIRSHDYNAEIPIERENSPNIWLTTTSIVRILRELLIMLQSGLMVTLREYKWTIEYKCIVHFGRIWVVIILNMWLQKKSLKILTMDATYENIPNIFSVTQSKLLQSIRRMASQNFICMVNYL